VEALSCVVRLIQAHWDWMHARLPSRDLPLSPLEAPTAAGAGTSTPTGGPSRAGTPPPPGEEAAAAAAADPAAAAAAAAALRREPSAVSSSASSTTGVPAVPFAAPAQKIRSSVNVNDLRNQKQQFQEGVALFNMKPKKGVAALQANGFVGTGAADVARFLYDTKGLKKTAVGEYLGEGETFPIQAMHAYIDLFDFTGIEFDESIRKLLGAFRLPGEAQKIDRIIEKFSER
jgi:hypothetical protein